MKLTGMFTKVRAFFSGVGGNVRNAFGFANWPAVFGGQKTKSGSVIDERRAEALSAVYSATRVVTEALAQLPLELREFVDARTTRAAYGHRLYRVMHDQPNKELTRFQFFDMQVPLQMNWGDCFSEIVRDVVTGDVVALWPIHYSRVEVVRGPVVDRYGNIAGEGGDLVFLVKSNDGSKQAFERNQILHVPGVMDCDSPNRRGRSIVRKAAEVLGIVQATQDHVAAFHRNGATPDIIVAFKGNIPPEDKQLLRESWSQTHGGTDNAHKALILSGDPTVTPVSINPKDALLIDGQRFGIEEVCRFWRVPPHLLYELGRATWSNIEDMGEDFLTFTLQAWISRWEGALNTQLLTEEEQQRYFFKFNVKGLLRGNSAARLAFYKGLFDMACISPDEIRELEDLNPIPGGLGNRYFIPGNNYVPLESVDSVNTISGASTPMEARTVADVAAVVGADMPPAGISTEHVTANLRHTAQTMLTTALSGLIRYQCNKVTMHATKPNFDTWCETFYAGPFRQAFDNAVGPVLTAASDVGCVATLESVADAHISRSKSEVLDLYTASQDIPVKEFEAKLSQALSSWSGRAATEAATAFAKRRFTNGVDEQ